jgi:hypothetical protein
MCNDKWIDLAFNKDKDLKKLNDKYGKYIHE